MYSQDLIEGLLRNELKGLCTNCAMAASCTYRTATNKIIIQCELYQLSEDVNAPIQVSTQRSLCINCCKVSSCKLPGKLTGIWHCEEYV